MTLLKGRKLSSSLKVPQTSRHYNIRNISNRVPIQPLLIFYVISRVLVLQIKQGHSHRKFDILAYNCIRVQLQIYLFHARNSSRSLGMILSNSAYKIANDLNNFISPLTLIHHNIITLDIYNAIQNNL